MGKGRVGCRRGVVGQAGTGGPGHEGVPLPGLRSRDPTGNGPRRRVACRRTGIGGRPPPLAHRLLVRPRPAGPHQPPLVTRLGSPRSRLTDQLPDRPPPSASRPPLESTRAIPVIRPPARVNRLWGRLVEAWAARLARVGGVRGQLESGCELAVCGVDMPARLGQDRCGVLTFCRADSCYGRCSGAA